MNGSDTVLPPRIRTELLNKPRHVKLWQKIAIALVLLIGLRHLNTVPQREWSQGYITGGYWEGGERKQNYDSVRQIFYGPVITTQGTWVPKTNHIKSLYTAEGLFGSCYRIKTDGKDWGVSSKRFNEIFIHAFGATDDNLKILRAINR
jgi:hypothetical protein